MNPRALLFEMLQPRIDHFFDPVQFRAPGILGVVKSLIDGIESSVNVGAQITQPRIVDEDSHKYGDCGNAYGQGDLNGLIGHRYFKNTP